MKKAKYKIWDVVDWEYWTWKIVSRRYEPKNEYDSGWRWYDIEYFDPIIETHEDMIA